MNGRLARLGLVAAAVGLAFAASTSIASAKAGGGDAPVPYGLTTFADAQSGNFSAAPQAPGDLIYHGGFIQDHVAVYLVFWGSQWKSDRNGVQAYMTNFFRGLGQSADHWSTVTSQYTGKGGHPVFGTSVLKGTWVDGASAAPANASSGAIGNEARRGLAHFKVAAGHNVSVIVLSPHGTHPNGFPGAGWCAWHSSTGGIPFTNMPYVLDAGRSCGASAVGGRLDGFSIVAGHEYLEAVTDPIPASGWLDSRGEENADKCAWRNLHKISLSTGSFAVQPTWSNRIHGCAG
jgi:serine protease